MLIDAMLVSGTYYVALNLRFDGDVPRYYGLRGAFSPFILAPITCHLLANSLAGVYRIVNRYIGLVQAMQVAEAGIVSTLVVLTIAIGWPGDTRPMPLSVVLVGGLGTTVAMVGVRFYGRVFHERTLSNVGPTQRLLLIGAGDHTDAVIREVQHSPELRGSLVGLGDDNPRLRGMRLQSVPVLGTVEDVPRLVEQHEVTELLITLSSPTHDELFRIHQLCRPAGVPLKTLPSLWDMVNGLVSGARELSIEDLLGRPKVETDLQAISDYVRGKRVLVTGAAGSIGSELTRQICAFDPAELILVDKDESALYYLHEQVRSTLTPYSVHPTSVALRHKMEHLFSTRRPQVVFHAAAFKHVPLMELNPDEAVINNIKGTAIIAECAGRHGVERMVNISTDKAVDPINIMGATKRAGEHIMAYAAALYPQTRYSSVRFGNVLGSRGSVIPVFRHQIETGGPVTITHPDMTRYFMTIQEAVQLVLQAAALIDYQAPGQTTTARTLVLEMGEPVRILDLAMQMIDLLGSERTREISIEYTGLRPGEKLTEALFCDHEHPQPTQHPLIRLAAANATPDDDAPGVPTEFVRNLTALITLAENSESAEAIIAALRACVPSYTPFDWRTVGEFPGVGDHPIQSTPPEQQPAGTRVAISFRDSGLLDPVPTTGSALCE